MAGAAYIYGDSPTPGEICSFPLRNCPASDANGLFGGNEPARSWFQAVKEASVNYPPPALPPVDEKYVRGAENAQVPDVVGMTAGEATGALTGAGFKVTSVTSPGSAPKGTVTGSTPNGSAIPGSQVTIYLSDGTIRQAPEPGRPPASTPNAPGLPPLPPFLPPIPIPVPIPR